MSEATRAAEAYPVIKGLVIDTPWIDFILDGSKTWEMRSSATSQRGWIGLIKKGSGAVHGIAELVDCGQELSQEQMLESISKHQIPAEMIRDGSVSKWVVPWKLQNIRRLKRPVAYQHRLGAVTWVLLDDAAMRAIELEATDLRATGRAAGTTEGSQPRPALKRVTSATPVSAPGPSQKSATPGGALVGEATITEGNLKNNHFYLRSFLHKFPGDAIGGSNKAAKAMCEVSVEWGGMEPVKTDIDGEKMFFRSRGWIGAFFKQNDAQAGDRVQVFMLAPYRYLVRLAH